MEKYGNAKFADLETYIPSQFFRLILPSQLDTPCGYSEYRVEIELLADFAESLNFSTPWDRRLYGFFHGSAESRAIFDGFNEKEKGKVCLYDWGDKILLLFVGRSQRGEKAFFCTRGELKLLLEQAPRGRE
ncbi:hypothetical protein FACS1894211_03900 [Clostridia bacterium]|nr:hypothetical protein FACS1894211_03900 [Clostridia bacterium]